MFAISCLGPSNLILFLLITFFGFCIPSAAAENPRVGLEGEFSVQTERGPNALELSAAEFERREMIFLESLRQIYGGSILRDDNREPYLQDRNGKNWWLDREWTTGGKDGLELVTPPLDQDLETLVENYDQLLKKHQLMPGHKSSFQINFELRSLIPGFSLTERPTKDLGFSYREIEDANISKVVDLFLFCEANAQFIYAAVGPRRLGRTVNYFSVPYSFEHDALLKELSELPPGKRTYRNVRSLFVKHAETEKNLSNQNERMPWKYRAFNLNKFLQLKRGGETPSWVYPALELRIADTPSDAEGLRKLLEFGFALFEKGSQTPMTSGEWIERYKLTRQLMQQYHMRETSAVLVEASSEPNFVKAYKTFISSLGFAQASYPIYASLRGVAWIPQTHIVFHSDFSKTNTPITYGEDVEFQGREVPTRLAGAGFLDGRQSVEETGNAEVRTIPVSSFGEIRQQTAMFRAELGDRLFSIHKHMRFSKTFYNQVSKQEFDAWLARIGDWVQFIRIRYRAAKYAFNTRTQTRTRVDLMNTWYSLNGREMRGTVRSFEVGDQIDVEIRGLMDGIFKKAEYPTEDLLDVATKIIIEGINNPHLIKGFYAHRLLNERVGRDPIDRLIQMAKLDEQAKRNLDTILKNSKDPELMLLPLTNFEFLPFLNHHQVIRTKQATERWIQRLDFLKENATDENLWNSWAKELGMWAKDTELEFGLFDSLLTLRSANKKWDEANLPVESERKNFLTKIIEIQNSEHSHPAIAIFFQQWLDNHRSSAIKAAQELEESQRVLLLKQYQEVQGRRKAQTLAKSLKMKLAPITEAVTNGTRLNALLGMGVESFSPEPQGSTTQQNLVQAQPPQTVRQQTPIPTPTPTQENEKKRLRDEILNSIKRRGRDVTDVSDSLEQWWRLVPDQNRTSELREILEIAKLNGDHSSVTPWHRGNQLINFALKVQHQIAPADRNLIVSGPRKALMEQIRATLGSDSGSEEALQTWRVLAKASTPDEVRDSLKEVVGHAKANFKYLCARRKTYYAIKEMADSISGAERKEILEPIGDLLYNHFKDLRDNYPRHRFEAEKGILLREMQEIASEHVIGSIQGRNRSSQRYSTCSHALR